MIVFEPIVIAAWPGVPLILCNNDAFSIYRQFVNTKTKKMKNLTRATAATLLLAVVFCTTSLAQQMDATAAVTPAHTNSGTSVTANSHANTSSSNTLVAAKFASLFPTAAKQQWADTENNAWVSFVINGHKATASFTPAGKINYVITECAVAQLPLAFQKVITEQYAAYHLYNAIEIKAHGEVVSQVVLENAATYLTLKYTSEGIEEIQRVNKTSN